MNKKNIISLFMAAGFILSGGVLTACSAPKTETPAFEPPPPAPPEAQPEEETTTEDDGETAAELPAHPKVEITMEDGGKILLELDSAAAPVSVENFLQLVSDEYYDGLIFHRVIPRFMIQGGSPDGSGSGGGTKPFKGEFAANGWDNPISHARGVISMARTNEPDSASGQFFITNADRLDLDGNYAAFGRVLDGMDVVDAISATQTDAGDRPVNEIVIKTIRVVE